MQSSCCMLRRAAAQLMRLLLAAQSFFGSVFSSLLYLLTSSASLSLDAPTKSSTFLPSCEQAWRLTNHPPPTQCLSLPHKKACQYCSSTRQHGTQSSCGRGTPHPESGMVCAGRSCGTCCASNSLKNSDRASVEDCGEVLRGDLPAILGRWAWH